MSRRLSTRRRALPAAALIAIVAFGVVTMAVPGLHELAVPPRAAGQTSLPEVSAQTDDSAPGRGVVMLGSSPSEAPGETWGISELGAFGGGSWGIVRYADGAGWAVSPWLQADGQPPSEVALKPDSSPLTGDITPGGAGVLLATVTPESGGAGREVVLVRNPGGDFQETPPVPETGEAALLKPGENLFSPSRAPLLAALEEAGGRAGALVVPINRNGSAVEENGVLHWDGSRWTREQIEVPLTSAEHKEFRVLAIGASSPGNAWLLGQLFQGGANPGAVALFRRRLDPSGTPTWQPVAPAQGALPGEPLKAPVLGEAKEVSFTVPGIGDPPTAAAQILTVTEEGVWIDGQGANGQLTMFFKPEGEEPANKGYRGRPIASWCDAPEGEPSCTHSLPEPLPSGPSRSIAWVDPSNPYGFGQRVITGLEEGVSLRLEGASFTRVLALGAGEERFEDVGGTHGAAFSNSREGWLGNERMPVHLTEQPASSRLTPYPVPFRHALLAVAAQPGAPAGALSSQALAVGDQGEVARYTPGLGWQPETLYGSGGRVAKPPLRGVAWPTPSRAYAVGQLDRSGDPEMWLWRGETGLWEPDPAAPRNFRGELLGIAFDPNDPTRGYAVGQQGVLLRYGKSWTQEPLPPEVQGASFTSIAFAGPQAIVAYRLPHAARAPPKARTTPGVCSSTKARAGTSTRAPPLPSPEGCRGWCRAFRTAARRWPAPRSMKRRWCWSGTRPGAAWEPTPVPFPGFETPGELALFREGGALRVVAAGGVPNTGAADFSEHPPPAGFPPNLVKPYPPMNGYVRRQTAAGWSDEEHERDEVGSPHGEPREYDLPYSPDPTAALLVDPTGGEGWAVGGRIDPTGRLDTADAARYQAQGSPPSPPGLAAAPVPVSPTQATFAVGGDAQCAAVCADRANARLGPDVWLSSALEEAGRIAEVRAFLYTGPRVTNGEGRANHPAPVNHGLELQRYAGLLGASPLPAFAAASPSDRAGREGECIFEQAFASFPAPFGARSRLSSDPAALAAMQPAEPRSSEPCAGEGQAAYYALDSSGPAGRVRVIVLDDSVVVGENQHDGGDVGETQQRWLAEQLQAARSAAEPAIVLGNANLNAQIAAGDPSAAAVARILVQGGASAYFYDAPEENITLPLRVGGESIPTFGSGTLGYASSLNAERQEFIGHSGFLLAQVDVATRDPATNRAPVSARLIPNVGELALEAQDGVLLHRSQPALFDGLARRPRAGCLARGSETNCETSPYIPIPAYCIGSACANGIFPEYSFSSSRPDIGDFVKPNLAASDLHAVLQSSKGEPVREPINPATHLEESKSGLFCAYNAGTTVVTISAGGLSFSLPVTVQAGSVRQPCGTQPLKEVPASQQATPAPPPAPAPAPAGQAPAGTPPPVPLPPPPPVIHPAAPAPPPPARSPSPPPPFFVPLLAPVAPITFLPPPPPPAANPTPPSGTSAVTSPVEAAQREEEEEEATESVSNQAVAYRASDHEPAPAFILGIVLIAAFAGAATARPRRRRGQVPVAPATLSTIRPRRRW